MEGGNCTYPGEHFAMYIIVEPYVIHLKPILYVDSTSVKLFFYLCSYRRVTQASSKQQNVLNGTVDVSPLLVPPGRRKGAQTPLWKPNGEHEAWI